MHQFVHTLVDFKLMRTLYNVCSPLKTLHIVSGGPDAWWTASKTVNTKEAAEEEEFYLREAFLNTSVSTFSLW